MAVNQNAINAPLPLEVKNGGTGAATFTAYAPIASGSTTTGAFTSLDTNIATSGYVLTSNGDGVNPTWKPGPEKTLVLLAKGTSANSTTVDFNGVFSSTYDNYLVTTNDLKDNTSNQSALLRIGTGGGPTYQATNYSGYCGYLSNNLWVSANSSTSVNLNTGGDGITSTHTGSGQIIISNVNNASNYKPIYYFLCMEVNATTSRAMTVGGASWDGATVLTSLRFLASSGHLLTSVFRVYGIAN